jgi:uncharacterized Zn finger protein (UPF0148 family)
MTKRHCQTCGVELVSDPHRGYVVTALDERTSYCLKHEPPGVLDRTNWTRPSPYGEAAARLARAEAAREMEQR